ncbi:SGNH hydrolase [Dichomitus squalens]|uniref:SGNH hydrolase n=1 Tax=Dichomitus squalens TaxID=114155 RepID=A0A4Q9MH79_9APHY|nr:SGNH hydrolase [Dichomitus squalens]
MKLSVLVLFSVLIASATALPQPDKTIAKRATPTLYLAGDSTMAKGGGGNGTEGWGQYLGYSMNIPVVNDAVGGTSARSYTDQGRFQSLVETVKSGDFVVIEFGHNDGGSLSTTDNGNTDCFGDGNETCISPTTGETVHTFVYYVEQAGKALQAKGANVIFSSQTPDNPWDSGTFEYTPSRFVGYAQEAAGNLSAAYVDHGQYVANRFQSLGLSIVDSFFPMDHLHTSPQGADVVSAAFVKGVLCANDVLAAHVKNTTGSVPGSCI